MLAGGKDCQVGMGQERTEGEGSVGRVHEALTHCMREWSEERKEDKEASKPIFGVLRQVLEAARGAGLAESLCPRMWTGLIHM